MACTQNSVGEHCPSGWIELLSYFGQLSVIKEFKTLHLDASNFKSGFHDSPERIFILDSEIAMPRDKGE